MADTVPVPDDALADLDDSDQRAMIVPTDNGLTAEDALLPQPDQIGAGEYRHPEAT